MPKLRWTSLKKPYQNSRTLNYGYFWSFTLVRLSENWGKWGKCFQEMLIFIKCNLLPLTKYSICSWFFNLYTRHQSLDTSQSLTILHLTICSAFISTICKNSGFFHFKFDDSLTWWRCFIIQVPLLLFKRQC